MARWLFLIAAILFFLFGLGFLGSPGQNRSFIVLGIVFFLLTLVSDNNQARISNSLKPAQQLSDEHLKNIQDLVTRHQKIEAIKLYHTYTGSSLKASKDFVESLEQSSPKASILLDSLPLPIELESAIRTIKQNSLIEAVREVRGLTGVSLREAKDYVDEL
jgi:ribosomal protein L7/L12